MVSIKTQMSNLDMSVVVSEIDKQLIGSWLNNIYQINNIFLFKFRSLENQNLTLLVELGKRVHLTNYTRETPKTPSPIVMSLRKKIKRFKVDEIKQFDLDRLLYIKLSNKDLSYTLLIELFSEGNLILLDGENKILYATKYRKMRDRAILPKREYIFPPKRGKNILDLTLQDLNDILDTSEKDLIRTVASNLNLAGEYAEEMIALSGLDPNKKPSEITDLDKEKILSKLKEIISKINSGILNPGIVSDNQQKNVSVIPFPFKNYQDLKFKKYETFNKALDFYFSSSESQTLTKEVDNKIEKKMNSLLKIKIEQKNTIKEMNEKIVLHKKIGDSIYANYHLINELLITIQDANKKNFDWDKIIEILNLAKEKKIPSSLILEKIIPNEAKLLVKLEGNLIDLDFRKSINDNANFYYSLSKKEESKLRGALSAIEKTEEKIKNLESQIEKEIRKDIIIISRKKEWYEKFRWFKTSDNLIVVGGRDAKTNEILIKKHLMKGDIVFHGEIHGAPIVILKTENNLPPNTSIREAAQFAASFSRAWQNGSGQIDVYWVEHDQISFTPPSGQYLPKGSFIITGSRNYIKNVKLELAVGIQYEKDLAIPICGPPSAILKISNLNLILKFGNTTSGKLAKIIKNYFLKNANEEKKKLIANISIDEFQNILPPKGSDIEI